MNRVKSFVGLAAVVLLVGTASLAQAQRVYLESCIGRLVRPGNWTASTSDMPIWRQPSSTMAGRQPSPPRTTAGTTSG